MPSTAWFKPDKKIASVCYSVGDRRGEREKNKEQHLLVHSGVWIRQLQKNELDASFIFFNNSPEPYLSAVTSSHSSNEIDFHRSSFMPTRTTCIRISNPLLTLENNVTVVLKPTLNYSGKGCIHKWVCTALQNRHSSWISSEENMNVSYTRLPKSIYLCYNTQPQWGLM